MGDLREEESEGKGDRVDWVEHCELERTGLWEW